mgnify:CR=1 FL=1
MRCKFLRKCKKYETIITEKNYDFYRKLLKDGNKKFKHTSWYTHTDADFSHKLFQWFETNFFWKSNSINIDIVNMKTLKIDKPVHKNLTSRLNSLSVLSNNEDCMPVYICKSGNIVCLRYKDSCLCIAHQDQKDLKEFVDMINTIENIRQETESKTEPEKKKQCTIQSRKSDHISTIPIDRNFDNFVSKHKTSILNALEDLKKSLNSVSQFGGFGSYNLGIMLHGLPGTGKTSIIKAICNYLQRDAYIVDMRKIKTSTDFTDIFNSDYKDKVYVFEEIDCVKGILSRKNDSNESEEIKQKSDKEILKQEYIELLKLSSGEKLEKDSKSKFDTDLEALRKKIDDCENQLTLDTMLTVLDGINEYRGRVIIATTNYIERIDSALLREGRFDLKIKLEQYDENETRELLTKMFKDMSSKEELKLLETTKLRSGEFTPVQIINLCHKYRTLSKVLECVKEPK